MAGFRNAPHITGPSRVWRMPWRPHVLWLAGGMLIVGCSSETPYSSSPPAVESPESETPGSETPTDDDIARLNLDEPELFSGDEGRTEPGGVSAESAGGALVRQLPDMAGIHNVYLIGNRVLCGSRPEGALSFEALRDMGVRVVVSVDGTLPDVVAARQAGLQYVHVPIGYGGIDREQQLSLARVLSDRPEALVFFHCQHGKHRGPAAAAVACRMQGLLTAAAAEDLLQNAGTSPDYAGLWQAVRSAEPRREAESAPELRESVPPPAILAVMQEIDHQFGVSRTAAEQLDRNVDEFRKSNALLNQLLKEAARLPDGRSLAADLDSTADAVLLLNSELPADSAEALQLLAAVEHRCMQCHARTRDADGRRK